LGCVSQLMGWVGSGHTKWTHGQLCDGAEKVVCPTQTSTNNIGPHSLLQNHSLREKTTKHYQHFERAKSETNNRRVTLACAGGKRLCVRQVSVCLSVCLSRRSIAGKGLDRYLPAPESTSGQRLTVRSDS